MSMNRRSFLARLAGAAVVALSSQSWMWGTRLEEPRCAILEMVQYMQAVDHPMVVALQTTNPPTIYTWDLEAIL